MILIFGSIHATCQSALATDRAMEAWYPQAEGHMASYIRRRKFLATLLGGAAMGLSAL
jgi:hypothetical protein